MERCHAISAVSPAKERRCAKAKQRRLNANIPTTIDEGIGQTYNVKDRGNFRVGKCGAQESFIFV